MLFGSSVLNGWFQLQMLFATHGMQWEFVKASMDSTIPQYAVVGAYSPRGRSIHVAMAYDSRFQTYTVGNYEDDNYNDYITKRVIDMQWRIVRRYSETWRYLVSKTNVSGVSSMFIFVMALKQEIGDNVNVKNPSSLSQLVLSRCCSSSDVR